MSLPPGTFTAFSGIGNREDLSDIIYNIDPTDTPFLSSLERVRAIATNHEWQTQALAAANSLNSVLEGDDATTDTATATTRLGNLVQISRKVPRVSGTQLAVKHAGRGNELDYQIMLKGKELKRDMETILWANQPKASGNFTTPRALGAVLAWIGTNTSKGTSGADPSTSGNGASSRVDGSMRAFTEALLKSVLQSCWINGGQPDTIYVGAFNKQNFSQFTGRASPIEEATSRRIVAAVDAYESDFGKLKVVPDRFMRARDCGVIQTDMWGLATLRDMETLVLAKTGDSEQRELLVEYTLESRNEKANGFVADLTSA